ncbi:hypothetical protein BDF20DRAFT_830136, partial [Mycotypha africana]|uniref:uncharacterized protein n=1 Tax=Mycotypha africana TaxID=64632 RepID=UPI0023004412
MTSTNHSRSRGRLNRDAPIVHYNGQNQTLESLTAEKLVWIRTEPANAGFFLKKNPLIDYHDSIVLRKPLRLSNIDSKSVTESSAARRLLRCIVTVDDHTYFTSYVQSSRSGKNSSVTEFDETFLIDIEHPTTMTVGLYYAHNKGLLRRKQSCANLSSPQIPWQPQRQQADVCLGYATIDIDLKARAKSAERLLLDNHNEVDESSSSNNCQQLLVVHGIYLSQRIQDYLHNSVLHSDYITIQVRHG